MRAKISAVCAGGLACGVDDLGQTGAESAVVVDLGVVEVFKGKDGEAGGGLLRSKGAELDLGEEFEKGGLVHFDLLAWYAAMAAWMTCLTGTLWVAAAARQSSNSGVALSSSLASEPTLMRMSP